jgi:hypothetical protein
MIFWSFIVEKTSTFHDEMIHIILGCAMHLHGHQNKLVSLMKPSTYLWILTMALNSPIAPTSQIMTFETIVYHIRSVTTTLTTRTWSFLVMKRLVHNETLDIKAYHHFFHTTCPLFWARAYMTFQMASCVAIHCPPNEQWTKCMLDVFNLCPHSHVRKLNAKSWIKPKWKHNVEMKVKCAMWNKCINGLTTNHSLAPLLEQKQMWALDAEEMDSSSKIDLRDVSWWKSIKDAYRLGVLVTTNF